MLTKLGWRLGALSRPIHSRISSQSMARSISSYRIAQRPRIQLLSRNPSNSQIRSYTFYQRFRDNFRVAARNVHRKHPIGFPLTLLFALGNTALLVYIVYDFMTRVNPEFTKFPKEMATPLRKAVYYTEMDLNPTSALAYYKQALAAGYELGLHPFSDEMLGIRLAVASMLEKAKLFDASIEVLETIKRDCETWLENGRRRKLILDREKQSGKITLPDPSDSGAVAEHEASLKKEQEEESLRDKVVKKIPGISLKLADLYSEQYPDDTAKAEKLLTSAFETSRAELQRRRDLNLPITSDEENPSFLTLSEAGTACSELADHYVSKGRSDLATILYMQAISLFKEDEGDGQHKCIQAVLLNNIASQMAEQAGKVPIGAPLPSSTSLNPVSREQLLSAAGEWARKALDVAINVEESYKSEQCDQACVVALFNLGEIAEMQENPRQAEEFYRQAKEAAIKVQFTEGIEQAGEALKRLKSKK
ncbi:hypothetical protein MGYG_00921 [Nannizzia gypsea CBS 118893]|uniref:TPR domain-containing protein n=1 Tax=Arthroderma gypseum (strain ATCC MYA-4604 / CBS 118893) TaxID=535722 RepID=E5R2W2_ARTGP|nr:hypothetical protein MGYG_00921 [Nannizzia gypsea CBS 118893]EFQ97883.1 hypothetical protein MGYG_00921 [Nannizzia gypsea CBS 118893]